MRSQIRRRSSCSGTYRSFGTKGSWRLVILSERRDLDRGESQPPRPRSRACARDDSRESAVEFWSGCRDRLARLFMPAPRQARAISTREPAPPTPRRARGDPCRATASCARTGRATTAYEIRTEPSQTLAANTGSCSFIPTPSMIGAITPPVAPTRPPKIPPSTCFKFSETRIVVFPPRGKTDTCMLRPPGCVCQENDRPTLARIPVKFVSRRMMSTSRSKSSSSTSPSTMISYCNWVRPPVSADLSDPR